MISELRPSFPMRDIHGIACFNGRLWITCSFDNMVAVYDLTTGDWSRWYPAPHPADRDRDVHHFNTIRQVGTEICITAHQFGPSEILFYDGATLQLNAAVSTGAEAHNIFMFNGALATCSSRDGWCVNTRGERLRTGNCPRGIATTPRGNLLGISLLSNRADRASQDGVLRWYMSEWRFRTDYVLPRVGMVLDILELAEKERDCWAIEEWDEADITSDQYNHVAPGNHYRPGSLTACAAGRALDWHAGEETHRWMAAKHATVEILINPGETRLCIEMSSANPCHYFGEVRLNGILLGKALFPAPGLRTYEFRIPEHSEGGALLSFQVPYLWRPSGRIAGSQDDRELGLAVHRITVRLTSPSGVANRAVQIRRARSSRRSIQ